MDLIGSSRFKQREGEALELDEQTAISYIQYKYELRHVSIVFRAPDKSEGQFLMISCFDPPQRTPSFYNSNRKSSGEHVACNNKFRHRGDSWMDIKRSSVRWKDGEAR